MGVGVEAVITHHHLALVGNVRGHPGDELQIVHRLQLGSLLTMTVADFALGLHQQQPLQRKNRPNHVLTHPLGLELGLGPDETVDIEPRVPPGKQTFCPFRTQHLPANEKSQDLPGEELSQSCVVEARDHMEDAHLVHPALGRQEMEVGMKIDPEKAILLLETDLILGQEALEVMEKHPIKDSPLRMSRTIDSRHGGRNAPRNRPTSCIRRRPGSNERIKLKNVNWS